MKKVRRMYAKPINLLSTDLLPIQEANLTGNCRMIGKGRKISAPKTLKRKCTKAKAIAASVL